MVFAHRRPKKTVGIVFPEMKDAAIKKQEPPTCASLESKEKYLIELAVI